MTNRKYCSFLIYKMAKEYDVMYKNILEKPYERYNPITYFYKHSFPLLEFLSCFQRLLRTHQL